MQREFTYQMPYGQLAKVYRAAGRKAFPDVWLLGQALVALVVLAGYFAVAYGHELSRLLLPEGSAPAPELPLIILLFVVAGGIVAIRRLKAKRVRERVDFDGAVSFSRDEGGLHFNSDSANSYLKWMGISQLLPEAGGVVVSHGAAFAFIPNEAFDGAADRRAFIEDVYGRLGEAARARSEKYVRKALAA